MRYARLMDGLTLRGAWLPDDWTWDLHFREYKRADRIAFGRECDEIRARDVERRQISGAFNVPPQVLGYKPPDVISHSKPPMAEEVETYIHDLQAYIGTELQRLMDKRMREFEDSIFKDREGQPSKLKGILNQEGITTYASTDPSDPTHRNHWFYRWYTSPKGAADGYSPTPLWWHPNDDRYFKD
jgi:hypothetical protein